MAKRARAARRPSLCSLSEFCVRKLAKQVVLCTQDAPRLVAELPTVLIERLASYLHASAQLTSSAAAALLRADSRRFVVGLRRGSGRQEDLPAVESDEPPPESADSPLLLAAGQRLVALAAFKCSALQELNLNGFRCSLGATEVRAFAALQLRRIELSGVQVGARDLLLLCSPNLEVLDVSWTLFASQQFALEHTTLFSICQRCPRLRTLDVSGFNVDPNLLVCGVLSVSTSIQHLRMSGCTAEGETLLSEEDLEDLTLRKPQRLVALHSIGSNIHPAILQRVFAVCPLLRSIALQGNVAFGDREVRTLATHCAQLRAINIADTAVSNAGVRVIAKAYPSLRQLNCSWCEDVSDETLALLLQRSGDDVEKSGAERAEERASDECVGNGDDAEREPMEIESEWEDDEEAPWVATAPREETEGKRETVGEGEAAARHRGGLRTLVLKCVDALADEHLALLGAMHMRLEELDVSRCSSVGGGAVAALSAHCQRLRVVRCSWIAGFSDDEFGEVLLNLRELEVFDVEGCKQLSNAALAHIVDARCTALRQVSFNFVDRITDDAIRGALAAVRRQRAEAAASCDPLMCRRLSDVTRFWRELVIFDYYGNRFCSGVVT